MRIHEAGQQGVIRAFDGDAGLVFLQRFGAWQDVDNAAVVEHHGMFFENPACGLNRYAPARRYQGVTVLHLRAQYTHLWYDCTPVLGLSGLFPSRQFRRNRLARNNQ